MQPVIRVFRLALDFHGRRGLERQYLLGFGPAAEIDAGVGFKQTKELVRRQEQRVRRQQRALLVAPHQAMAALGVVPETLDRSLGVAVQHQDGVVAEVIEQRGGFIEKERQVILDAARSELVGDILVNLALARVAFEAIAKVLPEAGHAGFVERYFARRQQVNLGHLVERALGVRVEGADRLDLVVEQVDAVGQGRFLFAAHRKQVEDAAAHGELARRQHLVDRAVAGLRQARTQLVGIQRVLFLEQKGVCVEITGRTQALHGRGGRCDQYIHLAGGRQPERGKTLRDQIGVGRQRVVRQRFPVRQKVRAQTGGEPGHFLDQPRRILRGLGQDQQTPRLACEAGNDLAIRRAGRQRDASALAGWRENR